jgi:formylglycine-generating enzyme required for sulfatase activity
VDTFPANAWGLQDMHCNVWEWCVDHWHDNYAQAPADGRAWPMEPANNGDAGAILQDKEERRLLRGGPWGAGPGGYRSAYRDRDAPVVRPDDVGFRVCCLPQDWTLYP